MIYLFIVAIILSFMFNVVLFKKIIKVEDLLNRIKNNKNTVNRVRAIHTVN